MTPKTLIRRIGKTRGHFDRKENRAAKLIEMWPDLERKFVSMIERGGGTTETARCAYATLLMMETGIRIGNESSAEGFVCDNRRVAGKDYPEKGIKKGDVIWQHPMHGKVVQTYGLTTLLHSHVSKKGKRLDISFVGKKIVEQSLCVKHPVLIKFCPRGARDDLFLGINYNTLKKFIKRYVGRKFMPKDIRTAKVNLLFVSKFTDMPHSVQFGEATTKTGRRKALSNAIEEVACEIGHTKSVCRSAYLSKPMIDWLHNYEKEK